MIYKPIFPWFGGKSSIADVVWDRLGNPVNYVEPFFGSGAVLFLRPDVPGHIETVNDADGFVANFWRAMQLDSESVAYHADNPVNECDLHARHLWLLGQRENITDRLCGDPDFFDAKVAGWWVWGQCCWIGGGWCSGEGPWQSVDGKMTLGDGGTGAKRQRPHLGTGGRGVHRQRPHLGDGGRGVNRKIPQLVEYLAGFADRLRRVRVCCGDWSRVCGSSVTYRHGMTGVFLDPPYGAAADRDPGCYAIDSDGLSTDVREWAIEQGHNPLMRICLAGYDGEHEMPDDWEIEEWKTRGGYANQSNDDDSRGRINKARERLWFSPSCLKPERVIQMSFLE